MSASHQNPPAQASRNPDKICAGKAADIEREWQVLVAEAERVRDEEPHLAAMVEDVVLSRRTPAEALAARLARRIGRGDMPRDEVEPLFRRIFSEHPGIVFSAMRDMRAIFDRDPACFSLLEPFLFFKGFLALTTHRVAHQLWRDGRRWMALYLQSVSSEVFAVDIHPAARIGCGILLDHATSFVVGETAIIEDDVSILHEVTLGGTGKESGDRHPIVRSGVLLGAGAKILGRVEIGTGAKVGAGSVVLTHVPPHTTVAGVPAVVVGTSEGTPAMEMNQSLVCQS